MSHKSINSEFYEKTRAFVISALKVLGSYLCSYLSMSEQTPYSMDEKTKLEEEVPSRAAYETHIRELLSAGLIGRHKKELEILPEYNACINVMHSDPIISKHIDCPIGIWYSRIRMDAWSYLSSFLRGQLLISSKGFNLDSEVFDCMYYDLEKFFYSDKVVVWAFSPLHNFSSDVDKIDLDDGLYIRQITKIELAQLLASAKWSQIPYFHVLPLKYAIELTYKTKKEFGELELQKGREQSPIEDRFNKLVTALRLFKSGNVGFNIIKTQPRVPIMGEVTSFISTKQFWGSQNYTLSGEEVREFQSFWNWFNTIESRATRPLSIVIRRFNYVYERDRLEDKLIDYMIAFEALFFKQGEIGELRHKLAVRSSRLLKKDYKDRKEIMKQMKDFYEKRSKVVHGEEIDLSSEFIDKVEEHLRNSIMQFLERLQEETHDEIISQLDLA